MRTFYVFVTFFLSTLPVLARSNLPVYIEDNHAGSYYFLARELEPHTEHLLLLFDAHSDATGLFGAERARRMLARTRGTPAFERLLQQWRKSGFIQCYSWIEPWATCGPDRSRRASTWYMRGKKVPHYSLLTASPALRSRLLQLEQRVTVNLGKQRYHTQLKKWKKQHSLELQVSVDGNSTTNNDCLCLRTNQQFSVRLNLPPAPHRQQVRWFALLPAHHTYNLTGKRYGFADNASPLIRQQRKPLPRLNNRTSLDSLSLRPLFDHRTGCGTVRLFASSGHRHKRILSPIFTLGMRENDSFPGRLTGLMGLPYILGAPLLRQGRLQGAELLWGADCSAFVVYAARCLGSAVPYRNPAQLRPWLRTIGQANRLTAGIFRDGKNPVQITLQMLRQGLVLHFGSHLAVLYRDTRPMGILDSSDLVIHQLEDFPRIVTLGSLKYSRQPFDLCCFRKQGQAVDR